MSDRVQLKRPSPTGDTQPSHSIFMPVTPSSIPTTQPTQSPIQAPIQAPLLGHDFSRISIQPKLTVSQPDDPYEQEADRVAGEVMRMGDPMMSGGGVMRSHQDTIHRKCDQCEDEEEVQAKLVDRVVQRNVVVMRSADGGLADSSIESRLSSKGGGSPLSDEVRSFMEPRFDVDFSQVRVHTDSESGQMNQDLNAQAFAHKQDVYFGAGKAPGKDALTAHELTHVVQQTGSVQRQTSYIPQISNMKQEGATIVASQGLVVQRFESSEHKFMGDEGSKTQTGNAQTVELAKDYFVSFGDVTAMAGDYFGSVEEIKRLAQNDGKGKGTREEIEFVRAVKIHGHKEQEKSFSDTTQQAVMERYYKLAGSNASHFTQPLGGDKTANSINNFGSYHDNHENALKLAARAGAAKTSINDAMLQEAFASHFLTDAFSAGHIRTERVSISEWWNPKVPMFWINLKLFIAEQMAYYINDKTTVAGTAKTVQQLWETVRETLEKKKLPTLTFGDFVSGALHDYDSEKGVATQHGKLLGDGQLRDEKGNPIIDKATGTPLPAAVITENAGINAVRLSLREVEKAYALGSTKSKDDVVAALRNGGLYTAEKLWPKAKPDAEQESKRPKWQQDSVSTLLKDLPKDPAMKEAIEIFGRNKAKDLKEAITFEDETFWGVTVVSAKLQSSGFQERIIDPLTSNPVALLERIISYTPNTGGGVGGHDTDDNAREYVKKAKAEGALGKLTQQQRSKLIRDMIAGSCGDEDEQAINEIIAACGVSEMVELVRSLGGGNINKGIDYLDSGIDGAEWKECKNLLRRSPELAKEL